MSVRLPPLTFPAGCFASLRACLALCSLLAWLNACSTELDVESDQVDGGPCGRGKARSCQCDDGRRGIAQCLVGGDWGECWCDSGEGSDASSSASTPRERDAAIPVDDLNGPKSAAACDQGFDLRAHAAGSSEPYLLKSSPTLTASKGADISVCFFFKTPYPVGAQALAFEPMPDEVTTPRQWALYGVEQSTHVDGEVFPCSGIEPDAYLLTSFTPASDQQLMPGDVALTLPSGASAGLILELRYADPGPVALLDKTGIRVCADSSGARKHTAAVHFIGSEGICIPPVSKDYQVQGVCSPRTDRGDIHILSVKPRMHALGKRMSVSIVRKDGSSELLHDEPFYLAAPIEASNMDVVLAPGDRLETRCYYDNPGLFPVPFGDGVFDELCYAHVTAWPAGALSVDPGTLDPLRTLGLGIEQARRCLDPIGIFGSCSGPADYSH